MVSKRALTTAGRQLAVKLPSTRQAEGERLCLEQILFLYGVQIFIPQHTRYCSPQGG